jgi:adenylate kinase family enzyme
MRELGELRRVREKIEEKKEVVGLIQRIEEWQKKGVAEKLKSYREEVEEVVEHYKKKKFDFGYGNSVMGTSVY